MATDPNLVACDTCTFRVHDQCDADALRVLGAQLASGVKGPYNCPSCRRIREARHAIEVLASWMRLAPSSLGPAPGAEQPCS